MMKTYQTEEQLTGELAGLRQRVAELKTLATEHKRLEEALQESQQVLRKIFESVTDGTTVTDSDDIVTGAKPKNK
ncbi:hypothetical protein ES708_04831 [subsurface metagenome]